ncbi:ATPase [Mycobacterium uberis]|uniref:ATPase n=1 Tax=Mycobacterium uberis TaxID=2162698 RepID=A0A3E1HEA6_9MYCO|nr:ATPase [Mycobacterium uberis]RFD24791.1 ATPase [Mycobacterium uberis]
MTLMTDRVVRNGPERRRIKTLTQAALNADRTVGQVEDVLDGLGKTMNELNNSLSRLNGTVERFEDTLENLDNLAKRLLALIGPVETIVERIDYIVGLGETMLSPLSASEHAVRGVLDRLRNRTVQQSHPG